MTIEPPKAIEIFYSYSHADEPFREELEKRLKLLKRQGIITEWHDRDIAAGTDWEYQINTHLNSAQIILLLISPDFMASDYCYSIEMKRALERYEAREARVIPIILRRTDWKVPPLNKLQALPKDARPVTQWEDRDEAFFNVVEGIKKVIQELHSQPDESSSAPNVVPGADKAPVSAKIWSIPYRRNPFFTGREDVFNQLHNRLKAHKTAALTQPQAISGLGGIGKTQTAIEYAYRHRDDYHYIFWARADTREQLISDFITIAGLLNLPEKDAQDSSLTVNAVKRWLETHSGWLLILDNADDLAMAAEFLPSGSKGHILLTTRAQAMGSVAQSVEIEKMRLEEGALFLLHRAHILGQDAPLEKASPADRATAQKIVEALDGLPLALDQAGAYIEETQCSLFTYLNLYHKQHAELLKRRGGVVSDHPEPVATTWKLSFQKVEQADLAAADVLRLCAFLAHDAIPEEIFTEGASNLGRNFETVATDPMKLNDAIGELRKYSLVHRDAEAKILNVHRLVQAVLKDEMNKRVQRQWAERAVRAVNDAFPGVEYETWPECRRLLPHAQVCADLIRQWDIAFPEAAGLLDQTGTYFQQQGQYTEAEPLYKRALEVREKLLGAADPDLAQCLNNLAALYWDQGKYKEAEPLYQRALEIYEQVLAAGHPSVATSLNNLANLYSDQGKYEEAEPLYQRALAIWEKALGSQHPNLAYGLNNLAGLYSDQDKYEEAESLYKRSLAIREKAFSPGHPSVATSLNNLANLYSDQGKYEEAESLYERVLVIWEKALPDHPNLATSLENYAALLRETNREAEAEKLVARAREIREKYAPENPMEGR